MRSYIKIISLSFVFVSLFAACGGENDVDIDKIRKPQINLNPVGPAKPIGSPGKFNITTKNQGCKKGRGEKDGCVRFGPNQSGYIIFAINGNSAGKTCAEHAARVISKIQLTTTDASPDKQLSDKGDFEPTSYPLDRMFRDDGFPEVDITTGVVYEATYANPGISRVEIKNLNTSSVDDPQGVDYWYQVTVEKCTNNPNKYWVSDPRGENDGMD
ncbi:MAG: hypothetical protein QNK19_04480 [Xanthomonadales bacterium]|nr:hypothetical protein [Xanthomonadales bacterium]